MAQSLVTRPTRFVDANGIRAASSVRQTIWGAAAFQAPLPRWEWTTETVTDGFASERPVIVLSNAGVSSSSGATPARRDVRSGFWPSAQRPAADGAACRHG
jgi:hypothetical protein